jgi:hypothetical protein
MPPADQRFYARDAARDQRQDWWKADIGAQTPYALVPLVKHYIVALFNLTKRNQELVAAQARQKVTFALMLAQTDGDLLEQLIAHVVSEGIVDGFEVAKVYEK